MRIFGYKESEVIEFGNSYANLLLTARNFLNADDEARHLDKDNSEELVQLAEITASHLRDYKKRVPERLRERWETTAPIDLRKLEERLRQFLR